jgi:hypothetical protein
MRGNEMLDAQATEALWKTYGGVDALINEGGWVDDASAGIPIYYAVTGQYVAGLLEARGDTAQASQVMERVETMAQRARLR